LIKLFYMV